MGIEDWKLRSKLRRGLPRNLVSTARGLTTDALLVDWVNRGPVKENWGDALAPHLVQQLSGHPAVNARDVVTTGDRPVYTTIGSMLGVVRYRNLVVWGTGFVDPGSSLRVRPREICAVRGPMTRQRVLESGLDCPEVFGDPALLYSRLHPTSVTKEYSLGVIPHFKETKLPAAQRLGRMDGVTIIDIRAGITEVVDQINRCERIASASLHGLVAADGYGIPSAWVLFSDMPYGGGFKFRDYFASVGRDSAVVPLSVDERTSLEEIHDQFTDYLLDIDLDAFLEACPFLDPAPLPGNPGA